MTISYEAKAFYVPGILQFSRLSWASLHTIPLLMLLQYCCESINNPIKSYSYCFVDTTVEALAVIVRDHFLGIPQRLGKIKLSLFFLVDRHDDGSGGRSL